MKKDDLETGNKLQERIREIEAHIETLTGWQFESPLQLK
ncbi:hypothetical protein ES705_13325 [subsurface metagenome]